MRALLQLFWLPLLALLLVFVARQLVTPSQAHSWYPYDCCSDRDCWATGVDKDAKEPEPTIVPGGYLTHDGIFVAQRDTRPSYDGRYHVCRYGGAREAGIIHTLKGICLFVPQPTF